VQGFFQVVITSPDGIIVFTELSAGTQMTFSPTGIPAGRSIRGIPDQEVQTIRITMIDEMTVQVVKDTQIIPGITFPQTFRVAGKVPVSPVGFRGYCPPPAIRIRGCLPGCFP
jgi:hypothetical protein